MQCIMRQAVPEASWCLNVILECFLRAIYRNVVFFRSNLDGCHAVVALRVSIDLLAALANLMLFSCTCAYVCHHLLMQCIMGQALPEARWCLIAILECFLRAAHGNVVFSLSNMHACHKTLVFFPRWLLISAFAHLMFYMSLFVMFVIVDFWI